MTHLDAIKTHHAGQAAIAKSIYINSRTPYQDAEDWISALKLARKQISAALRASNYLRDISAAVLRNGAHMLAFRHITAPPISQDQFSLICPNWRKSTEKHGGPRVKAAEAVAITNAFNERRSRSLCTWIDTGRDPTMLEIRRLLWAISPLIASQQIQTIQRNRVASTQESAVTDLLIRKNWTKKISSLLDRRAELPFRHFMHKTRYATATATPQEVDIALGLKDTIVLAMECKVSNDATNSVKRINDVLKKSTSWRSHYGSFVKTAALLQGVIAAKDVARLIDDGVEVFWSHDLDSFERWLDNQIS